MQRPTDGKRSRRDAWLSLAVPVLLTAVALTQMGLARTQDLTPWRGAGFGMFSTVDSHSSRFVRVWLDVGDDTSVRLDVGSVPGDTPLASVLVDYATLPDQRRAMAVYAAIAGAGFTTADGVAIYAGTASGTGLTTDAASSPRTVERVHLEAWTTDFDGRSGELAARRIDATAGHP